MVVDAWETVPSKRNYLWSRDQSRRRRQSSVAVERMMTSRSKRTLSRTQIESYGSGDRRYAGHLANQDTSCLISAKSADRDVWERRVNLRP